MHENGPCLVSGPNSTKRNPYSWTEHFNVVYIDQPVGVGFSYIDDKDTPYPSTTADSSPDLLIFIKILYRAFPSLSNVDLHLSGESYGGRYIPALATAIIEHNRMEVDRSRIIHLRSLAIGNPWIDPHTQTLSMYEAACYEWRGWPPHLQRETCQDGLESLKTCEAFLKRCETDSIGRPSPICSLSSGNEACQAWYWSVFRNSSRTDQCVGKEDCEENTNLVAFLNSRHVFQELEIKTETKDMVQSWGLLNATVYKRYVESGDMNTAAIPDLEKILDYSRRNSVERGGLSPVDVLIYVGVADLVCNPDGVLEALRLADWQGKMDFRGKPWMKLPWMSSSGNTAGRLKAVPNLWFVEVEEAGHMVSLTRFLAYACSY